MVCTVLTLQGMPLSNTVFRGPCPVSDIPCAPGKLCTREAAAAADAAWAASSSACVLASSSCRLASVRSPDPSPNMTQDMGCSVQSCDQRLPQGQRHLSACCLRAAHVVRHKLDSPCEVVAGQC